MVNMFDSPTYGRGAAYVQTYNLFFKRNKFMTLGVFRGIFFGRFCLMPAMHSGKNHIFRNGQSYLCDP